MTRQKAAPRSKRPKSKLYVIGKERFAASALETSDMVQEVLNQDLIELHDAGHDVDTVSVEREGEWLVLYIWEKR